MRPWALALAIGLTACGRVGFAPLGGGDAGGGDDAPDPIDAPFVNSCATRTAIPVPASGIVSGIAASSGADAAGSCGGAGLEDAVYAIDLPDNMSSLLVAADLPGSLGNTAIHIRRDCDVPASEVACDLSGGMNEDAAQRLMTPGAGRYHVFIEEEAGGAGTGFEASIQVLLPENAACSPAIGREICGPGLTCEQGTCHAAGCSILTTIAVDTFATSTVIADTTFARSAHAGTCGEGNDGGFRGPEQVVAIDLQIAARLEVSTNNPLTSYDTLIYLRSSCLGTQIACDDDGGMDGASRFVTPMLPIGEYLLFIDGFAVRRGNAEVTIRAF